MHKCRMCGEQAAWLAPRTTISELSNKEQKAIISAEAGHGQYEALDVGAGWLAAKRFYSALCVAEREQREQEGVEADEALTLCEQHGHEQHNRIRELEAEVERLHLQDEDGEALWKATMEERNDRSREVVSLREALSFYGADAIWKSVPGEPFRAAFLDKGQRAREALAVSPTSDMQWYQNRGGLLERFAELDTKDWTESDFFRFLEKPWQYAVSPSVEEESKREPLFKQKIHCRMSSAEGTFNFGSGEPSSTEEQPLCIACGRDEGYGWLADERLWDAVMPAGGVICSVCFGRRAESMGVDVAIVALTPDDYRQWLGHDDEGTPRSTEEQVDDRPEPLSFRLAVEDGCWVVHTAVRPTPRMEVLFPVPIHQEITEASGDRLYNLLAFFDTRDGSQIADLVKAAREGYERSAPEMGEANAWAEFDARFAALEQQEGE